MIRETKYSQQGFTLIELSIVLVIIGLLVGGVLVGQDLIKAAEVRATISQVEKFNTAVNTFRIKFNEIPGDMTQTNAGAFGLLQLTNAAPLGQGDGNGIIEGGAAGATIPEGETLAFWAHLSQATLIPGQFGTTGNSAITAATGITAAPVTIGGLSQSLPPTKLTPTQYFIVYSVSSTNYYQILPVSGITAAPAYSFGATGITPIAAYNIDSKVDDGNPNTGTVVARGIAAVNAAASWTAATTAANCMMSGTSNADVSDTYNRVPASGGNDPSCSLRFRFQ